MLWFKSQKDETIEHLVAKLAETQLELSLERQKRVAAEEISTALKARCEAAEQSALRADNSRDEALKMYTASLAATTEKLLDHHISPEGPMPDIKSFTASLGSGERRVPAVRKRFKDAQMSAMRVPGKPTVLEPKLNAEGKPTLGLREQAEALKVDDLIH